MAYPEGMIPFTYAQTEAILAACDSEIVLRDRLWSENIQPARIRFADVRSGCLAVQDNLDGRPGFENAHQELQAALEEVDCHPLWVASAVRELV